MGLVFASLINWNNAFETISVRNACPNVKFGICNNLDVSSLEMNSQDTCEDCAGVNPVVVEIAECPVCIEVKDSCILPQNCRHAICASCQMGPSLKLTLEGLRKCPNFLKHKNEFCFQCALDELDILKAEEHHKSILKVLRICPMCRSALRTSKSF